MALYRLFLDDHNDKIAENAQYLVDSGSFIKTEYDDEKIIKISFLLIVFALWQLQ
jgi:hypothetical protein